MSSLRPLGLVGAATIAAVAAGGWLAALTIHPPPLRPRHAKTIAFAEAATDDAPAFGNDVVLPAVPPPANTADAATPAPSSSPATGAATTDVAALPIEVLRRQANLDDLPSMEEMARRLIGGIGIAADPAAGAGWMLRAAERGSAQAAYNVGVMYERGFVVERDSTRAAQWYRRAADANLPSAQHNLALMLRDGKGVPRDGALAVVLLRAAAHKGMTASMFMLGDIFETGDAAAKDPARAAAWFAITAAFEHQNSAGRDTQLARTAMQRSEALERTMTPAEMEHARDIGQDEYRQIVEAMSPPPVPKALPAATLPPPAPDPAPAPVKTTPKPPTKGGVAK